MNQKQIFIKFIEENFPTRASEIIYKFEEYHKLLTKENEIINLVSRKTNPDDYWTLHYYDSVLASKYIDFFQKKILDFGTGGGLPGIPLKILYPESTVYFLDSIRKKINSIDGFIKNLDLKNCFTIVSRIEEVDTNKEYNDFDIVVCRSVKIIPKFKKSLTKMINFGGKIVLYKSQNLEDVQQFHNKKIYEENIKEIGLRRIIEITK